MTINHIERTASAPNIWRFVSKLFAKYHNQCQFFGYEVANILLVVHETTKSGMTGYGFNLETYTALFFLAGSACIWCFDPEKRPQLLFFGGLLLTIGGVFLINAGYGLTGWAVVIASLESARGGFLCLQDHIQTNLLQGKKLPGSAFIQLRCARFLLGWYVQLVSTLSTKFNGVGRFINERPFLTGTLIKAPFRLEFIIKKLLIGDWVGVLVMAG